MKKLTAEEKESLRAMRKAFLECLEIEENYNHVENSGDYFTKRVGDTLKIFFEESDDDEDWVNNFNFIAIPWKPYKGMKNSWYCHKGFLKVWKSIKPYIEADIKDPEVKKIQIVGYSHGAAIALLCHEYCVYNRPDIVVEGVGFGCPRVFWGKTPAALKERVKNFKAIRNGNDIVTHVPPAVFGYHHVTELVKIGQTNPINDHRSNEYLMHMNF